LFIRSAYSASPAGCCGFSVLYLKEPLGWNLALIAAGAAFVFSGRA
jgi:uncharacterized protein (DUF486 family)